MELLKEYMRYFDLFGFNISFRHENYFKFKTFYGGFITLICSGFLLYSFINISYDCFYKKNPIVRESSYYSDYSIVKANEFFYGLHFTDIYEKSLKDVDKYLIFYGVLTNYTDIPKKKTIPFVKCDLIKHFRYTNLSNDNISAKIKNFNETYCLDIDEDFVLINSYNEIPRISLSIYVIECENDKFSKLENFKECATREEKDKIINSFIINSFFFNSYIEAEETVKPNKANIKKESLQVFNGHACDKLFVTYKYSESSSDHGLIFQNPVLNHNMKISNYVPDQVPNTKNIYGYNIIYQVIFDADHFRSVTYVKFLKLQEVLATIGGIITLVKLMLKFLFFSINRYVYPFTIFNQVYINNKKYNFEKDYHRSALYFENFKKKIKKETSNKNIFVKDRKIKKISNKDLKTENDPLEKSKDINKIKTDTKSFLNTVILSHKKKEDTENLNYDSVVTNEFKFMKIKKFGLNKKNKNDVDKSEINQIPKTFKENNHDRIFENQSKLNLKENHPTIKNNDIHTNSNLENLNNNFETNFNFENKIFKKFRLRNKNIDNKSNYKINLFYYFYAFCCRIKNVHEPLYLVLRKINKDMEINNYFKHKEDMLIIKELVINDPGIFDKNYDLEKIYRSIRYKTNLNSDKLYNYFRKSFYVN